MEIGGIEIPMGKGISFYKINSQGACPNLLTYHTDCLEASPCLMHWHGTTRTQPQRFGGRRAGLCNRVRCAAVRLISARVPPYPQVR